MYTSSINNIVDINILDSIEPKPQLENSGLNNGAKNLAGKLQPVRVGFRRQQRRPT